MKYFKIRFVIISDQSGTYFEFYHKDYKTVVILLMIQLFHRLSRFWPLIQFLSLLFYYHYYYYYYYYYYYCSLFVCLFVWRSHHYRWGAVNFDLCSALMTIEQWVFFSVPHLLWHEPTLYNGNLREPVTHL